MSTPQPLLILTPDDLLAERWRALSSSPIRATELSGLDSWRKAGHRLDELMAFHGSASVLVLSRS